MAKLSKANQYAIMWLDSQGYTIDNIAKELNLTIEKIQPYISNKSPETETETKAEAPVRTAKTSKDFMIRHSQNNVNSVSIMTQQASMLNDESRKKNPPNTTNTSYIHKIT
jgi:orotate phosphoribosyltransferase-like protein